MPKHITLEKWKERIHFVNPHMDILNEILPDITKGEEFILYCNDCGATIRRTHKRLYGVYNKLKNKTEFVHWCPVCHNQEIVVGINDIATTRPDLVEYFDNKEEAYKYSQYSNQKIWFKCPECGHKQKRIIADVSTNGFSCELCADTISFPNKICRALLKQLPVDEFEPEYIRPWTQGRRYDGYFKFDNQKYLLEFDGNQHVKGCTWTSKEKQKEIDKIKDDLAIKNNYHLIRIDCYISDFDYIKKQIYNSELNTLFNLDDINWEDIYALSFRNRYLDIVNYYKTHDNPLATEIVEKFNISRHTVYHYLQKADKLGLVNYKPSKNNNRITQNRLNNLRKNSDDAFYLYNSNKQIIDTFYLISDCVSYLKNILPNEIILDDKIGRCLNDGTSYKGYTFEYINKNVLHGKNNELIENTCNYFLKNQNKNNRELAKDLNLSDTTVAKYLRIGIHRNIIDLDILKPCAFEFGRFKDLINERSD